MSVQETILQAARSWLKSAASVSDAAVIIADGKGPRPALPYLSLKLTLLHERQGEDERGVDVISEERVDLTVTGARRAVLSVRGFGEAPGDWLAEAELALSDPEVVRQLAAAGIALRSLGPLVDVAALLDTAIEARWSQDYELTYQLRRRREALAVASIEADTVLYRDTPTEPTALSVAVALDLEP